MTLGLGESVLKESGENILENSGLSLGSNHREVVLKWSQVGPGVGEDA